MSLDGFIAGPGISSEQPMGEGGPRLHEWIFSSKTDADEKLLKEIVDGSGAVIVGERTYLTAIDIAWEGVSPFKVPAFVPAEKIPKNSITGFTFVTDGIESVLAKARAAAGEKNVWVLGGANTAQQFVKAGLLDELHIHIAPVLLGKGTRLFEFIGDKMIELEKQSVVDTPGATHLLFRFKK